MVAPLAASGVWAVAAPSEQTAPILIGGAITAAALSIVPRLYVFLRRRRRFAKIRAGLPDTIDMLGMCLEGGLSLSQSLQHVASQLGAYPELAEELLILRRQAEVGSLVQALADLGARADIPEIRQLVNLLGRSDRLGTRLSGSLLGQADQLRVARRQAATLTANKAPVKLVLPLVFCFAPAAIILMTAPAMLELKEFFAPTTGRGILTTGDGGFGPANILRTLDEIEQPSPTAAE